MSHVNNSETSCNSSRMDSFCIKTCEESAAVIVYKIASSGFFVSVSLTVCCVVNLIIRMFVELFIPVWFWVAGIIISVILCCVFSHLKRPARNLLRLLKELDDRHTDILDIYDICSIFNCDMYQAYKLIEEFLNDEYFNELHYHSSDKLLFFFRDKYKRYKELTPRTPNSDNNDSKNVVTTKLDILRIQDMLSDLRAAQRIYKKKFPDDDDVKEEIKCVVKLIKLLIKALSYDMESVEDVHKVYTYYLPTLIKVIFDYCNLTEASINEQNELRNSLLATIHDTQHTLTTVCRQINDNDGVSLSVEMTTMKAVMSKDGYLSDAVDLDRKGVTDNG